MSLSAALEAEQQRLYLQEEEDLKKAMAISEMEYRSTQQKDQFNSIQMEALQSKPAVQQPLLSFEDEGPSSIGMESSTPMMFGSVATDSGMKAQEEEAKRIELQKQKQEEEQRQADELRKAQEKRRLQEIEAARLKEETENREKQRLEELAEQQRKADEAARIEQEKEAEQKAFEEQKRIFEEEQRKLEE